MNTKIYSTIATVVMILAILTAGYFYWQGGANRKELVRVQDDLFKTEEELQNNREELNRLRALVDQGLEKVKYNASILKDSAEVFLVAGDTRVASLGISEAKEIEAQIQKIEDRQDRIALESLWSDFTSSRTISNYLAFSRFLVDRINNNLENIH